MAGAAGVGEVYSSLVRQLRPLFDSMDTTRSSLRFTGSRRAIFSILPGESARERGLYFQVYWKRLCEYFGREDWLPAALLPASHEAWAYTDKHAGDPNWVGYAGHFRGEAEVSRFVSALAERREG